MTAEKSAVSISVEASAGFVFSLVTDAPKWPWIFPWILHTECSDRGGADDVFTCWGLTPEGTTRIFSSRRHIDRDRLVMDFEQREPVGDVRRLSGRWTCVPDGERRMTLRQEHTFEVAGDDPESAAKARAMFARHGSAQLNALKERAEGFSDVSARTLALTDSVQVKSDLASVYEAFRDASSWPKFVSRVDRAVVAETPQNVQFVELSVRDGHSVHTTRSARVGFPRTKIVYKQTEPSDLFELRAGYWSFAEEDAGVVVTAGHTAIVTGSASLASADAPAEARRFLRGAMSAHLHEAKKFVENQ
ncbi:hypothetical protein G3I59_47015 [Amycolatopsis rubida]|uniref:Coenzyme Q-binding protein COQ10 START domain-containing protein n=1 Tax=Amycolatopsis rubida TaxID=112413 RepID=A0ABX0C6L2_9PSEU|nr:SRPBCC family protein [Amycolatopsis sp. M39]MYW97964.1 hypothetical protein [Amycolatopsis rubida]NEC62949.1 hypothetical protein [Amycolatopsis rubida]OAP22617.1 Polyketide cyclase / dehydrase and lipid transport [Amycolatopsis sp. M39]